MNDLRKILINSLYLIATEQASRIINFFQVIILVRYLGKTSYGIWSLTQALPGMFLVLTDIGLNSILLRTIARDKLKQGILFQQIIFLKLILSVLFLSVMYFYTELSQFETEVKHLILLCSAAFMCSMFTEVIVAINRAYENFIFESIINIIRSILLFLFVLGIVFIELGLESVVYAFLIINMLTAVYCIVWYGKKYSIRIRIFNLREYITLIKQALPFALHNIISPIFMQIDIVMLSSLSTFTSVGIYTAPYRIILFLYFIPRALFRTLFPRLSVLYVNSSVEYKQTFKNMCLLITLVGLPAAVGLFLVSDKIVLLLFSNDFAQSTAALKIMAISVFFYYLRTIFSVTLYSSNKEKIVITIFGIATALNALLDYILIPILDYNGAALASLVAEILIFCGYYLVIKKSLFRVPYFWTGSKIFAAAILMSIVILLANPFSIFLQIPLGAVTYAIAIYFFRVLSSDELNALKKLILPRSTI